MTKGRDLKKYTVLNFLFWAKKTTKFEDVM